MEKIYSLIRTSPPQFIPLFTKCQIEKYAMLVIKEMCLLYKKRSILYYSLC